jgi:hypothetical protein
MTLHSSWAAQFYHKCQKKSRQKAPNLGKREAAVGAVSKKSEKNS